MNTELQLSNLQARIDLAERIKTFKDVKIPRLDFWNYDACEYHSVEGPQPDCQYQLCGGDLFNYQRVGMAWLYAIQKGLLADDPGLGKTGQVLSLIAYLKQRGELNRRAVIIPNTPAIKQWGNEFKRWTKNISYVVVDGSIPRRKRENLYASGSDVIVIGSHVSVSDYDLLERMGPFDLVISDDVDPLLNHDNRAHRSIMKISANATRSFTVNATALQMRLQQLHAALAPAGAHDVFGSLVQFERRYIRTELVATSSGPKTMATGVKHEEEFQSKFQPMYIRRKATELNDVRMPLLMPPENVWLDMSAAQLAKYEELQTGILTLLREEGTAVKHVNALTKFLYGQQICAGLPALGEEDGPGASPKLDWLFHHLNTAWQDRKVIVFVKNVGMVKACIQRAQRQNVGMAMVWGQKQNADQRQEQVQKFWRDANCRLMVGTSSLERSLNLQVSNTVVMLDTPLNPVRAKQIVGRAKRAGSAHDHVFMFNLFMQDTQESRYLDMLRSRQSLYDRVFEEESDMYQSLSAIDLLSLVGVRR